MYVQGRGVDINYNKGLELWQIAADKGYIDAIYNLADYYLAGYSGIVDLKKAAMWYTKAADLGDAEAQYNLGLMYYRGNGVEKDENKATELWKQSAAQGFKLAKRMLEQND